MAKRTAARPRKPPPRLLMSAMNALPCLILRSPLHGAMSKGVLLLTFSGRKSGRRYTTPTSYVRRGDTLLMSTEAPWWKNLRREDGDGAPVVVRLRGRDLSGVAEAVTDQEGVEEGLRTILSAYPGYSRFIGVSMDENGRPVGETVTRAAQRGRVLIRVRQAEGTRADSEETGS